ncbi:unnamed protein product, partial [Ectocarpus sp. 12 AP-2014]
LKAKTFLVSGFIGGVVIWLLGWLSYNIILADFFPQPKASSKSIVYILLGCL